MKPNSTNVAIQGKGLSLWDRVNKDPRFITAKREIQKRYGLPLPYDIRLHHRQWLEWQGRTEKSTAREAKRGKEFTKVVHYLLKKFEVSEAWYSDFIAEIAGLPSERFEDARYPKFNYSQDERGDWKWECIITPETDLTNPAILEFIQNQQKEFTPQPLKPAKTKGSPRTLDWRSVYKWHKRYPLFSIEEIADKIEYAPETVKQKFRELEQADEGVSNQ